MLVESAASTLGWNETLRGQLGQPPASRKHSPMSSLKVPGVRCSSEWASRPGKELGVAKPGSLLVRTAASLVNRASSGELRAQFSLFPYPNRHSRILGNENGTQACQTLKGGPVPCTLTLTHASVFSSVLSQTPTFIPTTSEPHPCPCPLSPSTPTVFPPRNISTDGQFQELSERPPTWLCLVVVGLHLLPLLFWTKSILF